jgi:hypothetical protein
MLAVTIERKETQPYYKLTQETAKLLRDLKLTAAEHNLFNYLATVDPFGDRYVDMPDVLTILSELNISKATFYRAIAKFQEHNLIDFQSKGFVFRNLRAGSNLKPEVSKPRASVSKMRLKVSGMRKSTAETRSQQDFQVPSDYTDYTDYTDNVASQAIATCAEGSSQSGEAEKQLSLGDVFQSESNIPSGSDQRSTGTKKKQPKNKALDYAPEFETWWKGWTAFCKKAGLSRGAMGDKSEAWLKWQSLISSGRSVDEINRGTEAYYAQADAEAQRNRHRYTRPPHACRFLAGKEGHQTPYWLEALEDDSTDFEAESSTGQRLQDLFRLNIFSDGGLFAVRQAAYSMNAPTEKDQVIAWFHAHKHLNGFREDFIKLVWEKNAFTCFRVEDLGELIPDYCQRLKAMGKWQPWMSGLEQAS